MLAAMPIMERSLCRVPDHCYRFTVSLGEEVRMKARQASATDTELVRALARGDENALAKLYDRYGALLTALGMRMLGDGRETEDLLHDVFMEVWRAARSFNPERGSVRAWLVTRMRSRALDRLRARRRARVVLTEEGEPPETRSVAPDPAQRSDYVRVRESLQMLSVEHRRVLELGYFGGLSSSEIAEHEGIPIGTVKSRVARALSQLRQLLGDPKGGPRS